MRRLFSFLTTLAATTIGTTALEASIYTFGPEIQGQDLASSIISSATLQQLLEVRSRSSTTSTLERSDEDSVEFLSKFAGPPNPLFAAPIEDGDPDTIFVILEGLSDDIDSSIRKECQSVVAISSFPTVSARNAFFDSLLDTHIGGIVDPGSKHCSFHGKGNADSQFQKTTKLCLPENIESHLFDRTLHSEHLRQISTGETWINGPTAVLRIVFEPAVNSQSSSALINSLKSLFSDLHSLSLDGKRATAVVLPNSNITQKSYRSRRAPEPTNPDSSVDSVRGTHPVAFGQQTKVPLSLAPVCYASNSSCNDATNTCSGHGVCYKKSGSESEEASGDCYACRCYETLVKNKDGTERKVQWGGSACQKLDISSPFFLIFGVTIALIVAISAAIGMTYSVGNTELPGVISAGVGAARVQK